MKYVYIHLEYVHAHTAHALANVFVTRRSLAWQALVEIRWRENAEDSVCMGTIPYAPSLGSGGNHGAAAASSSAERAHTVSEPSTLGTALATECGIETKNWRSGKEFSRQKSDLKQKLIKGKWKEAALQRELELEREPT